MVVFTELEPSRDGQAADRPATLGDRIDGRTATLGVVGLGHVGVPVAATFAAAGFRVVGIDLDPARVACLQRGESPFLGDEPELAELVREVTSKGSLCVTTDYGALSDADVILVAVETSASAEGKVAFASLEMACRLLGARMKEGTLVIVESTVAPGTCEGAVSRWLADASGRSLGDGFLLGHCPERVMPGRLLRNLRTMPRVCGGADDEARDAMRRLYRAIVDARLDVTDLVTAELVKVAENAYRDVAIAFANQLARVCEATNADFSRVRELVNLCPGRDVLAAGAGVGGHCIPEASRLLAQAVPNLRLDLLGAAREVNDAMPEHALDLAADALAEHGRTLSGSRVAILGWAYRENCGDARGSPSAALHARLVAGGARVVVHDPWVPEHAAPLDEVVRGCDVVVLMVAHAAYATLDLERMRALVRTPALVDGRGGLEAGAARRAGFTFRGIGRAGGRG